MSKQRPPNPSNAPWPPGVDVRGINHPTLGRIYQIRPGAWVPHCTDRIVCQLSTNPALRSASQCPSN